MNFVENILQRLHGRVVHQVDDTHLRESCWHSITNPGLHPAPPPDLFVLRGEAEHLGQRVDEGRGVTGHVQLSDDVDPWSQQRITPGWAAW